MSHSQESSQIFTRKIFPIKSVEQLVGSYLVAEILAEIRDEYSRELETSAAEQVPELDGEFDPAISDLYYEAASIIKFKPLLVYSLKYALEDMNKYNFKDNPSVIVAANNDTSHLQKSWGMSYKDLAKTNLFDHTINVFREALSIAKKKGRPASMSISIVGALLHDFGKSELIRAELLGSAGSKGYKAHAEVSATYVSEILSVKLYNQFHELPAETIETLSDLVKKHHPANQNDKRDTYISFIIEADHAARKLELREIMKAKALKEKKGEFF